MRKKTIFIVAGILIVIIIFVAANKSKKPKEAQLFTKVQKGEFEILVTVTGELEALNKEDITAPPGLRSDLIRLYQVKIQDLIPEGTVVDSGQYVATLDRTEITTRMREVQDELEKQKSNFLKTQLDTTIQLRDLRDQLINMNYDLEEKQITLDQSKFEPPATIRQAQINLDKAQRTDLNANKNYKLKVKQAEANMKEANINMDRQQRRLDEIMKVMNQFVITAPKKGMVIYAKDWNGQKRKVGSSVNIWEPNVATLPDLSVMISKTYVSEVDINKVLVGQKTRLGVDAFSDRKFNGEVIRVSNVGEQLPGSDSKVFEVAIRLNGTDPVLRPYMTTSNFVIINTFKDTTFVPIEAIHSQDSIPFVYTKKGNKQVVLLGEMNENEVIIERGLKSGEEIYLAVPEKAETFAMVGKNELLPLIKAKETKKKKEKEEFERKAKEKDKMKNMMQPGAPTPPGKVAQTSSKPVSGASQTKIIAKR